MPGESQPIRGSGYSNVVKQIGITLSRPILARDVEGVAYGIVATQLTANRILAEAAEDAVREALDVAVGGTGIGEAPGTLPPDLIRAGIVHPSGVSADALGTSVIGEKATFD